MKRRTFLLGATALVALPPAPRFGEPVPTVRASPIAAYGVVRVPRALPGAMPLMRVRRSDGVEADICAGPDGGLDTAALLAFVGAGDATGVLLHQPGGLNHWAI